MTSKLEDLKKMKSDLDGFIHIAETASERQKLADLQNEIAEDRARVKDLNARSYQIAIANQSRIKSLLEEVEKLRLESVDLSVDAWTLENSLRSKAVEMYQLEKAIKDAKDSV
jgi:predicted  nucleic acid-binding Zn-ribbon protein